MAKLESDESPEYWGVSAITCCLQKKETGGDKINQT